MRRFLAGALVLLAAVPAARAQEPPPEGDLVRVASIAPFTTREDPFRLTLQITNPGEVALSGVSVSISVHAAVISRSQLRASLDRGPQTALISAVTESAGDPIEPGEQRTVTIERPMSSLSVTRTGVFPVRVTVNQPRGPAVFHTAMPHLASEPTARLNVSWLLPVTAPSPRRGGGVFDPGALAALSTAQTAQQMNAIAERPRARVTLAPSASLLETLADLGDGFATSGEEGVVTFGDTSPEAQAAAGALDAVRAAAAAAADVAIVPYAPADLPTLAAHGPRGDLLRQITLGRSLTQDLLGRAPGAGLLVPPGFRLDLAAAAALRPVGVEAAVVDLATLNPPPAGPPHLRADLFGPSVPATMALRRRATMPVAYPDPDLRARMAAPDQGPLLAQALIAESASAWLEIPDFGPQRLLLIAPDRAPAPTAIAAALDGMIAAPWVRLRSLPEALGAIDASEPPIPAPRMVTTDTTPLVAARAARRALGALSQVTVAAQPGLDLLDRQVLLSESAGWNEDPEAGAELARAAAAHVGRVFAGITIAKRTVTLTSRRGALPVTVINQNPFPVRVLIRLDSARVGFPSGAERVEEVAGGDETFDFPVEARATGAFPVGVVVETPDGRARIAAGSLTVRSTAVSAVALTAIAGGGVFLFLAWFRRSRRRVPAAHG